mmetsp:Transcript_154807/g.269121  ORF Transcript_154807/g.269121 Transcript_154807/m.269121 type:complete len:874 (-) Transcript_154807:120-2741(-)
MVVSMMRPMMAPKAAPLMPHMARQMNLSTQQSAARISAFEAAIEVDAMDVAAWDGRLGEAVREGKAAPVFERAVAQFPTGTRFWVAYAEWCETQDPAEALSVYHRCLQQLPTLDLWSSYLNCVKRYQPLEEILRGYQRAIDVLGTDWRAGTLWAEYISLLKKAYNAHQRKTNPEAEVSGKLLTEDTNPIEAARRAMKTSPLLRKRAETMKFFDISEDEFARVAEVLKFDLNTVRSAFQRSVISAHSSLDKIWVGYEQFEKSLGNPQLAQKLLGEFMPRYLKGKTAFKELQSMCAGMEMLIISVPITLQNAKQQSKNFDRWRKLFHYERSNPLRMPKDQLQARVSLVYQQAALQCAYHAEVWHDFSSWLDLCGQREKATACLRQAVERFLPQDLTLRLLIASRHELAEVPPSEASLQAADDVYQKLLDDMPKPCVLALINYLAFVRRQRGAHDFRDAFLEATNSSPHCTWEVYAFAALTEYHVFGSTDAAARVFRLGIERYGEHEPSLVASYINFLTGVNDLQGARAELSRGVLDRLQAGVRDRLANRTDTTGRDSLTFLWQKWARLERYFGDAGAVRRALAFRDEEYRNFQRDQDVEEDAIVETPVSLGLSASIEEVEESFRFQHLIPQTMGVSRTLQAASPAPAAATSTTATAPAAAAAAASAASAATAAAGSTAPAGIKSPPAPLTPGLLRDHAVTESTEEHARLASTSGSGLSQHIARPDVSKMLAFRPALDVIGTKAGRKRPGEQPGEASGAPAALPTAIPKCLQDLLAVLPSRPLKGAKPDVDYLLTVLQTVTIPPVPIKELEHVRYDNLRVAKDEDAFRRRLAKDDLEGDGRGDFFSYKSSLYRDRLQVKRQKVQVEVTHAKTELAY